MDINKDEINPNKQWCLCKKKGIVGSKGNRFKNKSGWGGAGGRAQRLPPQCVPREKHIGTSLNGYIASKNEKIKKEAHRHKSRQTSTKMKLTQINDDAYAKKGIVGSKGNRFKNKSGWGGAGGRAQRLPPQCVPREKHIGTSLNGYIASKNEKIKKEAHGHKSRWISTKMKLTQINDEAYAKRKEL